MSSTSSLEVEEIAQFAESDYLQWDDGACTIRALAAERDRLLGLLDDMVDEYDLLPYGPTLYQMKVAREVLKGPRICLCLPKNQSP